ncbi:MAG: serine/threonine-protein kinase [Phycisphaerales bacterium]
MERAASNGDERPEVDAVGACLGMEALERIVRGGPAASPTDAAADAHLRDCSACRIRLEEMREAHAFIAEFASRRHAPGHGTSVGRQADPQAGEARHGDATASAPPTMRDDFPGYAVEALIAFGGQGAVYRARQLATGRIVAIKVPLDDSMRHAARRYRFRREIELTARLDHPGIVGVFGACETSDGRIGCVMEIVDGIAFDAWATAQRRDGRTGIARIVATIMAVADAIAYAHQQAVMHRDIKPSNIVVSADGSPRVLDFGLAKALDDSAVAYVTATGAFLGTLAYAAPEQLTPAPHGEHAWHATRASAARRPGHDHTDVRTDVHAIGLLLYEAIAGRLPYATGASVPDLIRCICETSPPAPSSVALPVDGDEGRGAVIDPDLDAIVLKAIAKEKQRRYQSAAELRDDLARWLAREPVRARFDSRWYFVRRTAWRHRAGLAMAALAAVVLAVLIVLGAIARAQAHRADLAAAVRDARALESHAVEIADARSIARDNFEAGERVAWNALLKPEAALVQADIEGTGAMGATGTIDAPPTSPAYWALWEMYARTPIVASFVDTALRWPVFDESGDHLLFVAGQKLQWWAWRRGEVVRELELPLPGHHDWGILWVGPAGIVISTRGGPTLLVDPRRATLTTVDSDTFARACGGDSRLVGARPRPDGSSRIGVWDVAGAAPRLLATHTVSFPLGGMAIDRGGAYLAVVTMAGELVVVDAQSGDLLLRRTPAEEPRFRWVASRGRPGELVVWGHDRYAVLDFAGDWRRSLDVDSKPLAGVMHNLTSMYPAPRGQRYFYAGDRGQVGIGDTAYAVTEGHWIPSLIGHRPKPSPDERHLTMVMGDESRTAVLDLAPEMVRHLLHPAQATSNGLATIFDIQFERNGTFLRSAAMDGSVRRYALADGSAEILISCAFTDGITRMALTEDAMFLGSHDLGRNNAQLVRFRDGVVETLISGGEQWFCGLVFEPGQRVTRSDSAHAPADPRSPIADPPSHEPGAANRPRLWALTSAGHLLVVDPESGAIVRETHLTTHPLNPPNPGFHALARLPGLRLLLAGLRLPGLQVLDENSLEPVCDQVAMNPVRAIAVSPVANDLFVTAHDDGMIRLWRVVVDGAVHVELVREMGSHAGAVFCAAFHPGGRLLATGGGATETKDVRIWDTWTGRELAALELFDLGVFALAFSPDGRWLAAGGEVEATRTAEGGQLFLIDLQWPNHCIAGNLEYELERLKREDGQLPDETEAMRRWAAGVRSASAGSTPTGP